MANFKDVETIYHRNSFSLFELVSRIKTDKISLTDSKSDYDSEFKSNVILTILMGFTVIPLIADEDVKGKLTFENDWLSICVDFLDDKFQLVSEFDDLNGMKFSELPNKFKNRIENYNVVMDIVPTTLTSLVKRIRN